MTNAEFDYEICNKRIKPIAEALIKKWRKWYYPDTSCPNLLDDGISWKRLMGAYYEGSNENGD